MARENFSKEMISEGFPFIVFRLFAQLKDQILRACFVYWSSLVC